MLKLNDNEKNYTKFKNYSQINHHKVCSWNLLSCLFTAFLRASWSPFCKNTPSNITFIKFIAMDHNHPILNTQCSICSSTWVVFSFCYSSCSTCSWRNQGHNSFLPNSLPAECSASLSSSLLSFSSFHTLLRHIMMPSKSISSSKPWSNNEQHHKQQQQQHPYHQTTSLSTAIQTAAAATTPTTF